MEIEQLYKKLKKSYTINNLNKISSDIISYYKNKQYSYIKNLSKKICHLVDIKEGKINKIFSQLIMLYHPDKLNYYQDTLDKFYHLKESDKLHQLTHILEVLNFDKNHIESSEIYTDIISPQDVGWGYNEEDLDYFSEISINDLEYSATYEKPDIRTQADFLSALKRKEYGNLNIQIDYHDLEFIEGELELSDYEIENLSGIEYCKNITSLDLSNNNITDISRLINLKLIEEVNLSNNNISDILAFSKLKNLRSLDISENLISDLNPIFELQKLKYINIIGNKIPENQIKYIKYMGVIVAY